MSAVVVPFLSVMVMVAPDAVCVTVAIGLNPSTPSAPSKSPRSFAASTSAAAALAAAAASVEISSACSYAAMASTNSVKPSLTVWSASPQTSS